MPANKIQLVIEIDEHGRPVIGRVEKDFDHLESKVKKTGASFKMARSHWIALTSAFGAFSLMQMAGEVLKLSDAASDFHETISKSGAIFREQAAAMEAWASDSARTMGLSNQAALEHAATMGNMFSQLGAGVEVAAKVSQSMVGLSADIASFNNVAGGASEVLLGMQSAFRGEYDALQRYIPTINAAAVQEQALAMTHKTSVKELTNMEKALAAVEIITRDVGVAAGDYGRTSGDLANQTRTLEANIKNLAASFGTHFIENVTDATVEINKFIESLSKTDIRDAAEAVNILAVAFVDLSKFLIDFGGSISDTWKAIGLATTGTISWKDAIFDAHRTLEMFNRELEKTTKLYSIGPWTKGWDIYMEKPPELPPPGLPHDQPQIIEPGVDLDLIKREMEAHRTLMQQSQQEADVLNADYAATELAMVDLKLEGWAAERESLMELANTYDMVGEHINSLMSADNAYISLRGAVKNSIIANILGYESFSKAMKKATAELLATISAEAAIRAIEQTAFAFAALAHYDFTAAGNHFKSAAIFTALAAAAGVAASALSAAAGGAGGAAKTGYQESRGEAVQSLAREGEPERYAQKIDMTFYNTVGTADWVDNILIPQLRKSAKRDTEITITYS